MQLAEMAPALEGSVVDETTALPPLNPLQSTHSHLYTHPPKQLRLSSKENTETERPKRRSSRQMLMNKPKDTENTNVKKRASRLAMFGLFNRHRGPEFLVAEHWLEPHREDEEKLETAPKVEDSTPSSSPQVIKPDTLNIASLELQKQESLRHRASKRALKTKESFTRQKAATWQPPPLFQAYPQSLKHATLNTPTIPAENLIRLNQERQAKVAEQSFSRETSENTKKNKDKRLHKSHAQDLAGTRDWCPKVFALVTEGYLLQYSGNGGHDRVPEKILPLCKDSAAFATDAIHGKPFVLQIAQISDQDGTINTDISKDLLKKANLKNEIRRSASAFLLVLSNPEEMNEWLVAVRQEIGAMGGKEYKPEVFGVDGLEDDEGETEAESPHPMQRMPSQRYLVKREPHRFSQKPPEPRPIAFEEPGHERGRSQAPRGLGISSTNRYSMATTDSTNSRYVSGTTASIDQLHLDQLRESPRQSYVSVDAKTASTSRCSSMDRSPVIERSHVLPDAKPAYKIEANGTDGKDLREHSLPEDVDRGSQQATPTPSASGVVTPTPVRVSSPPTPNFSVPSFSRRFSVTPHPQTGRDSSQRGSISHQVSSNIRPSSSESRPKSNSISSKRMSVATQNSGRMGTPPQAPDSKNRPQSAGNDAQFSRRNSSLNYARGISPVPLPSHSPSPHPPPSAALPPIPHQPNATRASLAPPPTAPLPWVPTEPRRVSTLSPLKTDVKDSTRTSDQSPKTPSSPSTGVETDRTRKLRRPVSMQVRRPPTPPNSHHALPAQETTIRFPFQDKPEKRDSRITPPPTAPPPPPPEMPMIKIPSRKGREPPPVPPYKKPLITAVPGVRGQSGERAPHPYIPPIKLSDRRSSGSLDGPWNVDFGGPKRTFLDLTTW